MAQSDEAAQGAIIANEVLLPQKRMGINGF